VPIAALNCAIGAVLGRVFFKQELNAHKIVGILICLLAATIIGGTSFFGGKGKIFGVVMGGLIIGVAETMIAGYVSSMYKDMFTYLILLIFLFVKPTGIFNEKTIQE